MKKLLSILLIGLTLSVQAQTSTQKVNNTATIYSTTSPVRGNAPFFIDSSLNVNNYLSAGTSTSVVTHVFANNNNGNPVFSMRNGNAGGESGFMFKDAAGTDIGEWFMKNNTSNMFLFNFMPNTYIRLGVGLALNDLRVYQGGTTNTGPLTVAGTNTDYVLRWTNGVTASTTTSFVDFKDELNANAQFRFYGDANRYIGFIYNGGIPSLTADLSGGSDYFKIRSVTSAILMVPDAADGSLKWAPSSQGIREDMLYYLTTTNINRTYGNRTKLWWSEVNDVATPSFSFYESATAANDFITCTVLTDNKFKLSGAGVFTIGSGIADSVTMNASTIAIPNGINIGSGQLNIPSSGSPTIGTKNIYLNTTVPALSTTALPAVGSTFIAVNTNFLYIGSANLGGPGTNWVRIATQQF